MSNLEISKVNSESWRQWLQKYRAIAVIRSPEISIGIAMAKAVASGGIKIIEITWNSYRPRDLIEKLRLELPDCIIGAGTILNMEDLKEAESAGAQFIFSPHVSQNLIRVANERKIPIVSGALTPTEIITAWQLGANCVKVFPVQSLGGINYLNSLQIPLSGIPLIPTGGITLENARDFIEAGAMAVGLSSKLFPPQLVAAKDWQAISQLATTLTQNLNL